MAYQRKWLQSVDVMVDQATGAILVRAAPSSAQSAADLLEFSIYHVEGIEQATWDIQYALADIVDPGFAHTLLAGDTSVNFDGLYCRIDYRGVPGPIAPLTSAARTGRKARGSFRAICGAWPPTCGGRAWISGLSAEPARTASG